MKTLHHLIFILLISSISQQCMAQSSSGSSLGEEGDIFLSCERRPSNNFIKPILDAIEQQYQEQFSGEGDVIRARASARLLSSTRQVSSFSPDELLGDITFGQDSANAFSGTLTPFENIEADCEYQYRITVKVTVQNFDLYGEGSRTRDTVKQAGNITIFMPPMRRVSF